MTGETRCTRPGCQGTIADGYCDDCGMAPRPESTSGTSGRPPRAPRRGNGAERRSAPPSTSACRHRLGLGLVNVPPAPPRDPATAMMAEPHVPENRRFCTECNEPVGRSRDGVPGRAEGSAGTAGTPSRSRPSSSPASSSRASTRSRLPRPRRPRLIYRTGPQGRRSLGRAEGPHQHRGRRCCRRCAG